MRSRGGRYVWHVHAIEATRLDRGCERDGRTLCQGVRGRRLRRGAIEFLKVSLCRGRFLQDQPGRMLRRSANTEFGGWEVPPLKMCWRFSVGSALNDCGLRAAAHGGAGSASGFSTTVSISRKWPRWTAPGLCSLAFLHPFSIWMRLGRAAISRSGLVVDFSCPASARKTIW
jgi:hypothetical protein